MRSSGEAGVWGASGESFCVLGEGDQKGTRTMQTMHLVTCSARTDARNHAESGLGGAVSTPGGQGVAGSNPVSPTSAPELADHSRFRGSVIGTQIVGGAVVLPVVSVWDQVTVWDRSPGR